MEPLVGNNPQEPKSLKGWKNEVTHPSLREVHASIPVFANASVWRKILAFVGPGFMVAVGYVDPGNWATDIAGGAKYGYALLSVILISNFMAILLQYLALKLGIVTGRDLAQACRDHYSKPAAIFLWIMCEIAIAATDLAEVIGSAIALNLLFKIPLVVGVLITAFDVMLFLFLQHKGFRVLEGIVIVLITTMGVCFAYELTLSHPAWGLMMGNLLPKPELVTDPGMLYISMGIIGATVMPHNLYLHSSIAQTRAFERNDQGKAMAIRYANFDSTFALFGAFFVNASILVLAADLFHGTGHQNVADINTAYQLLTPLLGTSSAAIVFAVALLASGQNSTLTGTLAGQIVMEGFLDLRLRPWVRRLMTRLIAIVPAVIIIMLYGSKGMGNLLIFSQVILSIQLGFAVFPLVLFTSDPRKMGRFVNGSWLKAMAWVVTGFIIILNAYLLIVTIVSWFKGG
ncbi:MAG: Nramp family divalent metal transporter [Candidatus Omnitrophica bacterium]|nr:Nramp family divalent metal transporter [Candidatus Omnitrophota bacterium]